MIVCLCHGVSESEVDRCVQAGAESLEEIGNACGAGTSCGCCREVLSEKLIEGELDGREALFSHEPALLAG